MGKEHKRKEVIKVRFTAIGVIGYALILVAINPQTDEGDKIALAVLIGLLPILLAIGLLGDVVEAEKQKTQ